ncbi:Hypothetical_protein [Hexamita inflata]|uniref:Hypothetical_protein n=1 Tax=Hexamita inflata TaxID=28002 RepID=A0AA86QL08_9EUKA|nr:Hypothetical protein HINF_LOCUS49174 [Hexamita inflata]
MLDWDMMELVQNDVFGFSIFHPNKQNDSLNCNLIINTKAQFNHSIFISLIVTIHKSKLSYTKTLPQTNLNIIPHPHCHSEQHPQTTQVSSALELTLLTSEVIFVTIFGMVGMNLGTSVSAATRSASKFRAGKMQQLSDVYPNKQKMKQKYFDTFSLRPQWTKHQACALYRYFVRNTGRHYQSVPVRYLKILNVYYP